MKRFHVHVNVDDLEASIGFYRMLFGVAPSVVESDYAKWMLDDPRVNFAISQRGGAVGIDHLGLQAEASDELAELGERLQAADAVALAEQGTVCCYARSDKFWAQDPQGVRWETFRTLGSATTYTGAPDAAAGDGPCCGAAATSAPAKAASKACC
ncbi:ArsI/CadI family heavy metal resistance metalloenzyme [Oleiagrimonas soli]|uniref:Catechol 2,3-dioxygenase-like lactoylglutathione lyase family enzyme n=1 Tax=Oleiagrimonas soli TaxID=1543381 RepID=A0A099CTW6_9GAMM|nr:ArsI/CadI family heavy metal resistance metalloenzyme [Oleiagrimonas soli]KGI77116.1 glyoxalase [Oleiagrimonas soli]MBB6185346.1 catechol 2,3-dioxygenase-like lactoylglutathione lyase family enzyme [Oleiagrimonas soli]